MAISVATRSVPGRLHLEFIDGLRGVAALYVVMHHVWQFSITGQREAPPSWFRVFTVFKYGSFAVAVFIVVSGYCLMLPVLRERRRGDSGDLAVFARRRSRRILPPYFVTLAGSMLLIALDASLRSPTGTPWDITLPSFSVGKVTSHLFLVHNWFEQWQYGFNPPLWSIALEYQIYFVFALVLLPVWRRWGLGPVVAVAFAIAAVPWLLGAGFASPWMLGMFAFGMAAAAISMAPTSPRPIPWRALTAAAVVAVPIVTALASTLSNHEVELFVCHLVVGIAAALGLVVMSSADDGAGGRVHRLLASRPFGRLGAFSYSLYLVHYPIVAAITIAWIKPRGLDVPTTFALVTLLTVPASLAVAYVFHRLVERRFLNSPLAATRSVHAVAPPLSAER